MIRKGLIILLFCVVGCANPNSGPVYRLTDHVTVTEGYYQGQRGVVTSTSSWKGVTVQLDDESNTVEIPREYLEK